MNYVAVKELSKRYGEKVLFEDLSFGISQGEKIALVAKNGSGKSSLLDIIAGRDQPDSGEMSVKDGLRIGYLAQDPDLAAGQSVRSLLEAAQTDIRGVIDRYEEALQAQTDEFTPENQKKFERASAAMDHWSAWDYVRQMEEMLEKLNITDLDIPVDSLSGGQKKRIALALMLMDQPDMLILDEPTNHLDIETIEWLEDLLSTSNTTFFMVTHDRYFLDKVCNNILELHRGKLYRHQGNYSYFLEKREERETILKVEVEKAGKRLKKEQEWMRRMPKARTTKAKSRIDAFYSLEKKAKSYKPEQDIQLDIKTSRIGGKVLELKNIKKAYGDLNIIDGFTYTFKKGEKVGIVGPNGVGKSTFLRIITGDEKADYGKRNVGDTIVFGHFKQSGLSFKDEDRVIDIVKNYAEVIQLSNGVKLSASQFLQFFLFSPDEQFTPVRKLSGGERRRLHLLTVLIQNPNFLILDEPTNDLDLLTLEKLEEFLSYYPGCLMIVSHDRYFMNKLVDHLFIFKGNGQIKDYNGTYLEFRAEQEKIAKTSDATSSTTEPQVKAAPTESSAPEMDRETKKALKKLENMISSRENKKKKLEEDLIAAGSDLEKLSAISADISELVKEIEELEEQWMELVG